MDDVTLGELARRMDRMESSMQASFKAIDDRLANNLVSREFYTAHHTVLEGRVTDLEHLYLRRAQREWVMFTALAAAMLTVVTDLVVHVVG